MSVISNFAAVPNRLAIVYRFLRTYPEGLPVSEAQQYLSPRNFSNDLDEDEPQGKGAPLILDVFREAEALGLLMRQEHTLRVPEELRAMDDAMLLAYLEQKLMADGDHDQRQTAFPRALAWFLTLSPASPVTWNESPVGLLDQDSPEPKDKYELTNQAAFKMFLYWARYLGFAWLIAGKGTMAVPDPTTAIERHLRAILRPEEPTLLTEAMGSLASACPVLEGGQHRTEVEQRLRIDRRRKPDTLSASTSLALIRLERRGLVRLDRPSDQDALLLNTWPQQKAVSQITLCP